MISFHSFRSKFAYRIFSLFILCAIVPLLLLELITYTQISKQLLNSAQERLHRQAKNLGMLVIERCVLAESKIDSIQAYYNYQDKGLKQRPIGLEDCFLSVAIVSQEGSYWENILGDVKHWPALSAEQKEILSSGKTIIFTVKNSDTSASIFMCKNTKRATAKDLTCIAEIKPHYLLGITPWQENPFGVSGISITEKNSILFTTLHHDQLNDLLNTLKSGVTRGNNIFMNVIGSDCLFSSAPIFLVSRMKGPMWLLIITEPKFLVFNSVKNFRTIFILVIVLAFMIVILLSTIQIRRYLLPLEHLKEGTIKISQGDLAAKVIINSGDEFDDLASSFNTMTTKIEQQFKTLNTISDIDTAILSEFDFDKIIDTFIERIGDVCPCDAVGVSFRYLSTDKNWMKYFKIFSLHHEKALLEVHNLDSKDLLMVQNKSYCLINCESNYVPLYLNSLVKQGVTNFLCMPILINNQLMAIVFMGWRSKNHLNDDYLVRARQITDQVAIALSHAYLINELHALNWGTLTALARVVDAKSPWTAGHSERVAAMSLRIGETMGINKQQLDVLNKACMLHDIGKVSTPNAILDKNGKLTPEEYEIIKEHSTRGALILEPIIQYKEMIPIVLQHHERFDGKGYPDNLSGDTISLGARILAVADTFDAMTSDRPYRAGMDELLAINEIRNQSGHQFDPIVVKAFLTLMGDKILEKECA